jgi:pimeloyl-ACP methyl ester carboxylesterase
MMARMFERLPELVNGNDGLVRRGRFLTVTFLIASGHTHYLVHVVEGRVARVERGPFLMRDWRFAVRASEESWRKFWQPIPEAGYHDLFAMVKAGHAVIEGDLLVLMQNLRYVQEVLAIGRMGGVATAGATAPTLRHGELEPIAGRYVGLTVRGQRCRVYFEEAGTGVPLVCLHTAGADNKQWRHLLNDAEVTRHFRVLAFDMPRHGKSLPPVGWQDEEYRLTTDAYVETILAFCDALALDTPVVLGCSIGGKIVLHLALRHPERFRALIGLEAAEYQPPWYDDTSWLHRPDIHGGEVASAMMSGLIAPQSPSETRWETLWGYAQGGPGVFRGDLHFYRAEGDLRGKVDAIDTRRCPLYLLTGDYDFSCTPDDSRRTAAAIKGAQVTVMQGLGHFPMSEHPARFRTYLLPVLDEIRAHAARP